MFDSDSIELGRKLLYSAILVSGVKYLFLRKKCFDVCADFLDLFCVHLSLWIFFFLLCFNPAYCFLCLIFLFVSLFLSHFDVYMSHHLLILSALIFLTFVILLF